MQSHSFWLVKKSSSLSLPTTLKPSSFKNLNKLPLPHAHSQITQFFFKKGIKTSIASLGVWKLSGLPLLCLFSFFIFASYSQTGLFYSALTQTHFSDQFVFAL